MQVFKMLLAKGRITRDLIATLSIWRHSGFRIFCGNRLEPNEEMAMGNLARYIIRASFFPAPFWEDLLQLFYLQGRGDPEHAHPVVLDGLPRGQQKKYLTALTP